MRHVNAIKNLVDQGNFDQAEEAIENLLALGPNNVEALKLLARMHAHKGNFEYEEQSWQRVWEIDSEDEDAIDYFHRAQIEDREHYYFTDILPEGGRRFLTYPRLLINMAALGLLGCISFIALTQTNSEGSFVQGDHIILPLFFVCVILPWIGIGFAWVRALKSIEINSESINFDTRLRSHKILWRDIRDIYLAHNISGERDKLQLVVITENQQNANYFLDLSENKSAVRARKFLLGEIKEHFQSIKLTSLESLEVENQRSYYF